MSIHSLQQIFEPLTPCLKHLKKIPGWTTGYHCSKHNALQDIRLKKWNQSNQPFKRTWYKKIKLFIYPGEEISKCVYLEGYYEPNQLYYLNSLLKQGMTFIDVGANSGIYSLFSAYKIQSRGLVLSFEPSQREFSKLKTNILINSFKNIKSFRLAISDSIAQTKLLIANDFHAGHNTFGNFVYKDTGLVGTETVDTITLDQILEQEKLTRVDVIKLDIEGSELKALRGAEKTIQQFNPIFLIEILDSILKNCGTNAEEVWDFLSKRDYLIFTYDLYTGDLFRIYEYSPSKYTDFLAIPKTKLHILQTL